MLAMEPKKKQEIIDDLETFSKSQDYYAKIGKAWKRGYLLYGPPGTGKSTMIGCMANFLNYDVYDIDLTAVKDNTELRHLIVNTDSKSIIVIEDIDCSLHLSGAREAKKSNQGNKESVDEEKGDEGKSKATFSGPLNFIDGQNKGEGKSKVTLSGLLNSVDGLWSACGGERLIVFTTNHVEELDPALIRRGRMDVHIELGYCGFEAFKVLAKNYLGVEEHPLFEKVKDLLEKVNISPAEVAESLMPKNLREEDKASQCLRDLVRTLDQKKQEEDGGKGKKETQVKQ
ncbi:AAA-ATPase At3g28580-like [Musa acuminata AAA Group]|uniref:AAA-ATPase At3g28580-like n=1 Tax=Musa acuminata AAA Group TaxID=214697 RepID=UPI0031D95A3B